MLELPALMYRDKGNQPRAGGTYSFVLVSTPEELKAAAGAGWYETLSDAIAHAQGRLAQKEQENTEPEIRDDAAPTREELETKANELGIAFHPKIGDQKLQEKVEAEIRYLDHLYNETLTVKDIKKG